MNKLYQKKELLIYLLLIIFSLAIMLTVERIYNPPGNSVPLEKVWRIDTGGNETEAQRPPVYFSGKDDDFYRGVYSFSTEINFNENELGRLLRPVIVFPYNAGNGLRLSINGAIIGSRGDLSEGRSSVWNSAHVFLIPPGLLNQDNLIKAEIYGLYEAGITKVPYFIDSGKSARLRIFLLSWGGILFHFLLGSFFLLALTFIITGIISFNYDKPKIYLGAAIFFITVFLLDYSYIDNLIIPYLVFKKIVIGCHFLGMIFFVLYINSISGVGRNLYSRIVIAAFSMLLIISIIHPGNMISYRKFYSMAYLSDFLLLANLLYFFIRRIELRPEVGMIFFGGVVALCFSLHDCICLFIDGGQVFLSQYGMVFLFLSGSGIVIYEIFRNYLETIKHKKLSERYYAESVRDALTGAYNRKILEAVEGDLDSSFSMLLFDLNDFKLVNDTCGHAAGDQVLRKFVEVIKSQVRNNDYVIRIGGDEFLVILPGCQLSVAEQQGGAIIDGLGRIQIDCNGFQIEFSAAFGAAFGQSGAPIAKVIELADERMYQNKNEYRTV